MNSKFHASVNNRDEVTWVKLAGVIDEDNELGTLAEKIGSGTAVIDVSEIERINSCGVRDWVNWLGRAEKNGASVVLVECSPAIVAQINLVNNFTGQGVVKSFYAPYFCPNCDIEKALLVETSDVQGVKPFQAPSCRCDECDGPMDFDDMEDSYFAFLGNTKKIVTDDRFNSIVQSGATAETPKMRSRGTNPGASKPGGSISSLPSIPNLPVKAGTVTPTGASPAVAAAADSSRNLAPAVQGDLRGGQSGGKMQYGIIIALMLVVIGILAWVLFIK
jgi:anti-anti-sigma regulatory factor